MNYSTHNLRTNLQEWKNRLYRAPYAQFGHQIQFLLNNFKSNNQIASILNEACTLYPLSDEQFEEVLEALENGTDLSFQNESHQAALYYQFLNHFVEKYKSYSLHNYPTFVAGDQQETRTSIVENFIAPIVYFLHDHLDKINSTVYLLEKYKKRTEWFTKSTLADLYTSATKNYEQIFEDDLRLFLFDQGIEYPFSTPSSVSGRADIIGEIETDDPLVIEIKIFDSKKNYGKDRIKDGFTQIVKYANDYNKDVGYLVIFNMDAVEIHLKFSDSDHIFPPTLKYNNKTFYFIVVNISTHESASKLGTLKEVIVSEVDLIK